MRRAENRCIGPRYSHIRAVWGIDVVVVTIIGGSIDPLIIIRRGVVSDGCIRSILSSINSKYKETCAW